MEKNSFIENLDSIRLEALAMVKTQNQADLGQYFTPPAVSKLMAGMFSFFKNNIQVVDPGAGVGSLSAAFVNEALKSDRCPSSINLTAYEIDPSLFPYLKSTLTACEKRCEEKNVKFKFEIVVKDFISCSVAKILENQSLFSNSLEKIDYIITNPPYKKINNLSKEKKLLESIGINTTNFYSAFLWLSSELLIEDGEMVAITPRSFCNGTYYKNFRKYFLQNMTLKRIHIFESRDKAFSDSDVLQENIIINSIKGKNQKSPIIITTNKNPDDEDIFSHTSPYDEIVTPNDPNQYIRILQNTYSKDISLKINELPCTLQDLDITVSTGKVVDFRSKDNIRFTEEQDTIPLLYPMNMVNGQIEWPIISTKKPQYLKSNQDTQKIIIHSDYYVFLKRFSSKEEKRRICSAFFDPKTISFDYLGIENHINFFHKRYGGLSKEIAQGLTIYLNSTIVDEFFRQFSGHTQVNAEDLRSLRYPSKTQLIKIGESFSDVITNQEKIDTIVLSIFYESSEESMTQDPLLAKKKINEALSILHFLNVPKAQQNDRSALTLLSLAKITPSTKWSDASENLIGITEMMDFFRENYGINYAPNTRETVRRQTIHQFLQMQMVIANPDEPERPINSPKTKYLISDNLLKLLRFFNQTEWKGYLSDYFKVNPSLQALGFHEREMPMIPVKLPNGNEILLSAGGQNNLIKKIVEEFCPRYTPGGLIRYIGDAGNKMNEQEIAFFSEIGIQIDVHGKMPDLIVEFPKKKWLVIIEAVTSHGPIDNKRYNELKEIFQTNNYGLVFLTAFETRKVMNKYLSEIAWETDAWVAESPSHMIHFNGERFLGPYNIEENR